MRILTATTDSKSAFDTLEAYVTPVLDVAIVGHRPPSDQPALQLLDATAPNATQHHFRSMSELETRVHDGTVTSTTFDLTIVLDSPYASAPDSVSTDESLARLRSMGFNFITFPRFHTAASAMSDSSPSLSERELSVLRIYASGSKLATVARRLEISPQTVKHHLKNIRRKFDESGRHSPTQLDLYRSAIALGLLVDDSISAR